MSSTPHMGDGPKARKNPRAQVSLVARYRSPTAFEFVKEECFDLSAGGMFIKSPSPAPAGTLIKLECDVNAGAQVIRGVARVVWLREAPADSQPAGMGVKFVKLEAGGREAIQAILKELGADASGSTPPPGRSLAPEPFPRTPSASPEKETFRPTAAQPLPDTAAHPEAPRIIPGVPAASPPQPRAPSQAIPDPATSARPSNRPEARDLRDRLENAKRAHEARTSERPPAMESVQVGRPAPRVDDPAERPTPLEMPRPAEVQAAIARAAQREVDRNQSKPAPSPGVSKAPSDGPKPAVAASAAAAGARAEKPAAAPKTAPAKAAVAPSASSAPAKGPSAKPFVIGLVAILAAAALYLATRPRSEEAAEVAPAPAPAEQAAAAPAQPQPPAEPPAPPPVPEPPPQPPMYVLEVESSPAGARVTAGDQALVTPGRLELGTLDAPIELKAEKEGFSPATATIDRVGFMLEDGRMRRRVVLALAETPKPAPPPPVVEKKPVAVEKPAPPVAEKKPVAAEKPAPPPVAPKPVVEKKPAPPPAEKPAKVAEAPAPVPVTPPIEKPAKVAAATPAPAAEPKQTPLQTAAACLATGDNACVVQALEGKAKSAPEMEMLIETYRAMGKSEQADKLMQVYVDKFPNERRTASYRRVLQRRQEETSAPAAAPAPAPAPATSAPAPQ
ncbi:MAG: PilZ domain-containing protein [Polyangiales bacterium]